MYSANFAQTTLSWPFFCVFCNMSGVLKSVFLDTDFTNYADLSFLRKQKSKLDGELLRGKDYIPGLGNIVFRSFVEIDFRQISEFDKRIVNHD